MVEMYRSEMRGFFYFILDKLAVLFEPCLERLCYLYTFRLFFELFFINCLSMEENKGD